MHGNITILSRQKAGKNGVAVLYQSAASRCLTLLGKFEGAQANNRANGRRMFGEGDQGGGSDEVSRDKEGLQD